MSLFRRAPKSDQDAATEERPLVDPRAILPERALASIPADQRGGPAEQLEDGRFIVVGRTIVMITDDKGVVDSGFWHEVQYASWDATTRTFRLVWSQPDRPAIIGRTTTDNPREVMEKITHRVDATIVATRRFRTSTGVNVAATVRRRVDGELFSAVIATGPISKADEEKAYALEEDLHRELNMEK